MTLISFMIFNPYITISNNQSVTDYCKCNWFFPYTLLLPNFSPKTTSFSWQATRVVRCVTRCCAAVPCSSRSRLRPYAAPRPYRAACRPCCRATTTAVVWSTCRHPLPSCWRAPSAATTTAWPTYSATSQVCWTNFNLKRVSCSHQCYLIFVIVINGPSTKTLLFCGRSRLFLSLHSMFSGRNG